MAGAVPRDETDSTLPQVELAALLARAARADEEAWRRLLALYGRRIFAMAKSRCRRDDLAEEITQSVFATVASQLTGGSYTEQGRFEPWLFRVAMNRIRDEIRRLRRHAEPTDPSTLSGLSLAAPEPAPHRDAADSRVTTLRIALEALNEADRKVVELRHHAGMSFRHIAAMLDEPLGTVLARHHRALRKIKDLMAANAPNSEGEAR